jgi:hypothetical protein
MVEVDAKNPYQIETAQFVFCIKLYDEGAAVWTDGARRIELENLIVLECKAGNLEAIDKRGGHFVCGSIINVDFVVNMVLPVIA